MPAVDEDFVVDRIADALDGGCVDQRAREELLAALAELDVDRATQRRVD
jgi:hypothetical protein